MLNDRTTKSYSSESKTEIAQIVVAITCLWAAASTLVKLSILHFYLTIFGLVDIFRYATYTIMFLVIAFGTGLFLEAFLTCRPFAKLWDPFLQGTCVSFKPGFLADGIINIVIDLAIVLLPMRMVWRLQHVSKQRKVAFTAVFALGILYVFAILLTIHIPLNSQKAQGLRNLNLSSRHCCTVQCERLHLRCRQS